MIARLSPSVAIAAPETTRKALVLDDDEGVELQLACKATRALGFSVDATADPARFHRLVLAKNYDVLIVDYKLRNALEAVGLRDGPALVAVTAAMGANTPTIMLTAFGAECKARMREFDPRLIYAVVDKPADTSVDKWTESLGRAIQEVEEEAGEDQPESLGVAAAQLDSSFFKLSASELHDLDDSDRAELEAAVSLELYDLLEPIWEACDADWLKLQRVGDTIMVIDRGKDADLPDSDDVVESEAENQSGILIVGRPMVVEEVAALGPIDCTPAGYKNWRRYPYVRLTIGSRLREFHLDTGNPTSVMSHEFLEAAGVPLPSQGFKNVVVSDLSGQREPQRQLPVDVVVYVDGPHGNAELQVTVQSVKGWRSGRNLFNSACSQGRCPGSSEGQCGRRLGLMGRDLLYCLRNGKWEFDPATGAFAPTDSYA